MAYNTSDASGSSTATDYIDLMDILEQLATSNHCSAVAVNNGGTGGTYAVDDILTIDNTGATRTHDITLRVTSVSAGQITGLRIETAGAYTVNPSTLTGNAVSGGGGTGATVDLTMTATGWTRMRRSQEAASATAASGGSGYTNGDVLTLQAEDSLGNTIDAQFTATVTAGAVTSVSLLTAGLYEEIHSAPTSIAVTGGTGTGCELNVTFQDADQDEAVLILQSSATGSPTVGIRVYSDTDVSGFETVYNWSLSAFTGFNSGLLFANQAGISPGDDRVLGTGGAYVTLRDFDATYPIDYWISCTDRRILGCAATRDVGINHYPWFHLGFLNPMGTAAEWPYPMFVCGSTSRYNSWFQDTTIARVSGLPECIGRSGSPGPGFIQNAADTWVDVRNSAAVDSGSPSRTANSLDVVIWPCGRPNDLTSTDALTAVSGMFDIDDIIPRTGVPGSETYKLLPTPMTGGDLHRRYPATIMVADTALPEYNIRGEIDGLFWVSVATSGSSLTSESELVESGGSDRYIVLQCGSRTLDFSYGALRED